MTPLTPIVRRDYAFPLRIDAGSQRTAQARYAAHVEQMIEQILLTTPGERVDNPTFGCGLRTLVFAPMSQALQVSATLQVTQALGKWLAGVITVSNVNVLTPDTSPAVEPGQFQVEISYTLVDTQTAQLTTVALI